MMLYSVIYKHSLNAQWRHTASWKYAYTHLYVWHSPSASGLTHHYNYIPYTHRTLHVHKINILDRCMIMGVLCILLGYVSTLRLTQIIWELFYIDSFSWQHLTVGSVSSECGRISKFWVFLQWFLAASSSWTWLWEVYHIPMKSASITNEKGITQLLVTCFSATL